MNNDLVSSLEQALKETINQQQEAVAKARAEAEAAKAKAEAEARSQRAKAKYLADIADYGLRYGQPNRKVLGHLAQDYQTSLDLAAKAVVNPLYGVSKANGSFGFQGQTYGTVSELAYGLSDYLGYNVDEQDLADLLLADLSDPIDRRLAIEAILNRQKPAYPGDLSWSDQLSLQALLGDI